MFMRSLLLLALLAPLGSRADTTAQPIGRPASAEEITARDITVFPDGSGLPPGSGSVKAGQAIYEARCQSCHGPKGQGGTAGELAGGAPLTSDHPDRTIGRYWPYATTVFDFIRRAMPLDAPRSLTDDQAYAVTAYVLFLNELIAETAEMNAKTLAQVRMPNRDGFMPIMDGLSGK